MSESDLTAKARRAAEWFNATQDTLTAEADWVGWGLYFRQGGKWTTLGSDRLMIAFCEDRGWQDPEADDELTRFSYSVSSQPVDILEFCNVKTNDDGVEWETTIIDQAEMPSPAPKTYGRLELTVTQRNNQWSWEVTEIGIVPVASGTAPTRAEARRQAVEAARGMGNEA